MTNEELMQIRAAGDDVKSATKIALRQYATYSRLYAAAQVDCMYAERSKDKDRMEIAKRSLDDWTDLLNAYEIELFEVLGLGKP